MYLPRQRDRRLSCVLILILGAVIRHLTKNSIFTYIVCIALTAAVVITYVVDATKFEGLLSGIMAKLSLFERFYGFVNGNFDLTSIVYYITVAIFFLFLSVQSMEKRRYN